MKRSDFTKMLKYWPALLVLLAIVGLLDATYLTFEHYRNVIPPCSIDFFASDCGKVLRSTYSLIYGIPLALIGACFYFLETVTLATAVFQNSRTAKRFAVILSAAGFLSSLYFVYLMLFVIGAICLYCMGSAIISLILAITVLWVYSEERKYVVISVTHFLYSKVLKNYLFRIDPEEVHVGMTTFGEILGKSKLVQNITSWLIKLTSKNLSQDLVNIHFDSPIGLAAGFDYEAKLTQILPSLGFGFETIGTITNGFYVGNPKPRLGRLPKSRSLMVNKGFKNLGAVQTAKKLRGLKFNFPLGISIGRTNTLSLKTQTQSVRDIVKAFKTFEKAKIRNSYYELNISCPNLKGDISFYPPKNLEELLAAVDRLKLSKPLFIKMPIEKTEKEVLAMLKVIAKHSPVGLIFGNLQKNRKHKDLVKSESNQFSVGYFSGKPTWKDSNRLISLSYRKYKKRFIIIGCGGVFNARDAYTKIKLGATLVQLITGMIYEGPQLIAQINYELPKFLERDGFKNISEAIGSKYNRS